MKSRLRRLQQSLADADLDLYLVSHLPQVRYLCGFSGSNGLLLVGHTGAELYTDGRYAEQVRREVHGARCEVPENGRLIPALAASRLIRGKHPRIGIQASHLSVSAHKQLTDVLDGAVTVAHPDLVEPLTAVKDATERTHLKRAAEIVDEAFETILPNLRPGMRELDVAAELEYVMLSLGSEGTPFETICASGARSALPHGRATTKRIGKGDFVTLDFGAQVHGYCSDITRTVVVGRATTRQRRVYDIVKRAQAAAIRRIRPGVSTRSVDAAARNLIKRAGYGKQFGHGTGHGLGLEVHQAPSLSPRTDEKMAIGMVVTVEPGIYIPGLWGVRIEDDVAVTRSGRRLITRSTRKLIEL